MKSLRNRMLVIAAVALVAVCASAIPASAQLVCKGSFTLSHEVRWQSATLPAGDYTFEMRSLASPSQITLKGPNGYQVITAAVANETKSDQSMLIIENRGNRSTIAELRLSSIGRSLRYSVPKAPKDVEVAQGPVTREQIVVAVNVK
ncbi:MAG: hypothetical protein JWO71_4311 [Candidatus Acidoferrum typicum]|nr:hypothetical protein [Candidatus Acidoferrum typicum]